MKNIQIYNKRMSSSLEDKTFFKTLISADIYVDYGCADGSLLKYLREYNQNKGVYIGYDNSKEMISLAKKNDPKGIYRTRLHSVINHLNKNKGTKCLILSSVIHEVYSYLDTPEINNFWNFVWNTGFNYIVIRDMFPSKNINTLVSRLDSLKFFIFSNKKQALDYTQYWGKIETYRDLYHFLLKYKYTENWDREVREYYFPCDYETFRSSYHAGYSLIYNKSFIPEFIKNQIKKDFWIDMKYNTHAKFIYYRP